MKSYILNIECITSTSPSSGESWGGYIDNDIVYDDCGLPYIPAKRIKGILAESMLDLVHILSKIQNSKYKISDALDLVGVQGQEKSSPLVIDDAVLPEYGDIRQWLKWAKKAVPEFVTTEQTLELFTTTRSQTSIKPQKDVNDHSHGVAEEHSFRIHRILNRKTRFNSDVMLYDDRYEDLLVWAAQVSRSMGLKRNRGLGYIEMKLLDQKTGLPIFKPDSLKKQLKLEANNE